MQGLRIVFMGTPDFSVPTLKALIDSKHKVVGVYCQPDKARGRGHKLQMPPVKECAIEHNISVYQPNSFNDETAKVELEALAPDLIIVIAYGKIVPTWVLELPKYGCINLHASILPAYRGAAPIQWSVLNGDSETGITIMQMDEGMDTGDILEILKYPLTGRETSGELFDALAEFGGKNILNTLDKLVEGKLKVTTQNHKKASYTSKITKSMGEINWNKSSKEIDRQIRGLAPWPSAFTFLNGKRVKIWKAMPTEEIVKGAIGEIFVTKDSLMVQTGTGLLAIEELQLDNKRRMAVKDFLAGNQIENGAKFASAE